MSYIIETVDTDKRAFALRELRARPCAPRWIDPQLLSTDWSLIALLADSAGAQTLRLCYAQSEFAAVRAAGGGKEFFRCPRSLVTEKFPDTASLHVS